MNLRGRGLARRLEAAEVAGLAELADAYRQANPASAATWQPLAGSGALWVDAGSVVNQAAGLGMSGPVPPSALDALEQFFGARGEAVPIEVCPLADGSLVAALGERGYRLVSFTNVLVRPLDDRGLTLAAADEVREAGPEEGATWVGVNALGFGDGVPRFEDLYRAYLVAPSARRFLVYADGRPAGAALVRFHGGTALLSAASVLPAFRGRGLHRALIAGRIRYAAVAGAQLALCRATPGSASQDNLERAGFGVVYTRLRLVGPAAVPAVGAGRRREPDAGASRRRS